MVIYTNSWQVDYEFTMKCQVIKMGALCLQYRMIVKQERHFPSERNYILKFMFQSLGVYANNGAPKLDLYPITSNGSTKEYKKCRNWHLPTFKYHPFFLPGKHCLLFQSVSPSQQLVCDFPLFVSIQPKKPFLLNRLHYLFQYLGFFNFFIMTKITALHS